MKQRVLAIVGAIGLVVVAVVVRQQLAGSDGGGASGKGPNARGDNTLPVVACTPDLATICTALAADGVIAKDPPPLDLEGAVKPPKKVQGWITWDPAPEIVNLDPDLAGRQWGSFVTVVAAPLGFSTSPEGRAAVKAAGCRAEPFDAGCVAKAAKARAITLGVGSGLSAESLARFVPLAPFFVDDSGSADQGVLTSIAGGASPGTAIDQVTDQTQPALGADIVFGPVAVLEKVATTAQGKRRELEVSKASGRSLEVVLASRSDRNLTSVVTAAQADDLKSIRSSLGLTRKSDPADTRVDAGVMYQVWKALRS